MLSPHVSPARESSTRWALVAMIAALAFLAVAPSRAHAAFTSPYNVKCTGAGIDSEGTTLQWDLQATLTYHWQTSYGTTQGSGCGLSESPPSISYAASSNDIALNAWGADDFHDGSTDTGRKSYDRFLAFDHAPNPGQMDRMNTPSMGTGQGKFGVSPIASAAIAIIVHFPEDCELRAGDPNLAPYARFHVPNATLERVFHDDPELQTWGQLLPGIRAIPNNSDGVDDAYCQSKPIRRVVRGDSDGISYEFKTALAGIDEHERWPVGVADYWVQTDNNNLWPNAHVLYAWGAGAEPGMVANTDGSIGYTDLGTAAPFGFQKASDNSQVNPDQYAYTASNAVGGYSVYGDKRFTFNQSLFWIPLETTDLEDGFYVDGSGTYAEPTNESNRIDNSHKGANCNSVPWSGIPSSPSGTTGYAFGDWHLVNGTLTPGNYPLCMLTYVGWWDDYADEYGVSPTSQQAQARTVRDYILYTLTSGQPVIGGGDFDRLPTDLKNAATSWFNASSWNK